MLISNQIIYTRALAVPLPSEQGWKEIHAEAVMPLNSGTTSYFYISVECAGFGEIEVGLDNVRLTLLDAVVTPTTTTTTTTLPATTTTTTTTVRYYLIS